MSEPHLLSIDNGTQSVRALIFDVWGNLLFRSQVAIEPYFSLRPGWAEQEANHFWDAICRACQGLWHKEGADPERVAAVAVTTQRTTMIALDDRGTPLRPAIVWLDQRRAETPPRLHPARRALFRMAGMAGTVRLFQAKAADNWIAENEPRIWGKTARYLLLSGYVNFRLTGEYKDSSASQVGYLPFDYKRQAWAADRDWKWKAVQVTRSMLPELVEPGDRLGEISGRAFRETGIPEGTPVMAAATDKACEVLGSGCTSQEQACLGYGTTATVNITSGRYVEPLPFLPPYPSAVPGSYSLEVQNFRGFWLVSWFKEQFGHRELERAPHNGVTPEELLDEMLERVPPGSEGLTSLPYWTPGVKIPGPEAMGAVIGFRDVHTRAHVYRCLLEGLAYSLREGKERLEKRTRRRVVDVRAAGGGSRSDRIMQLTADVFGLPVSRPRVWETSGLGAAICAAAGLGAHGGFREAMEAMTGITRVFEPDPAANRLYEELYTGVYKKMYSRLKPLYEAIRSVSG